MCAARCVAALFAGTACGERVRYHQVSPNNLVLGDPNDGFIQNAKALRPRPGQFDVVIHGNPVTVAVKRSGQWRDYSAKQLARLLDDLMDVARITRNRIELRVKSIDARTVVEMAIEATRSQFEANGQTLQVQLPEAAVPLQAGPARMDAAGETSGEEAAAYIAEAYENDRANAPASVQRWLADLLAAVKAWMFKKGIMGADRLTVADIAAVARANARSMARVGGAAQGRREN